MHLFIALGNEKTLSPSWALHLLDSSCIEQPLADLWIEDATIEVLQNQRKFPVHFTLFFCRKILIGYTFDLGFCFITIDITDETEI